MCASRRSLLIGASAALAVDRLAAVFVSSALAQSSRLPSYHTPRLDAAVDRFKSEFGSHTQYFRYGQFYLTNHERDQILSYIDGLIRSDPLIAALGRSGLGAFVTAAMNDFRDLFFNGVSRVDVAAAVRLAERVARSMSDGARLRAVFAPRRDERAWARTSFEVVWGNPVIAPGPPLLGGPPSLRRARAAFEYEKDKCFRCATAMASKLAARRGMKRLPPSLAIPRSIVANAQVRASGRGVQSISYSSPATLRLTVERMKAALRAGAFVLCGVLSGLAQDMSTFPNPEHFLLVFDHDTIGGRDAFVFWDADAVRSNILDSRGGGGWGHGFGCLIHADGHLSTAFSTADLAAVDLSSRDTNGDHLILPRRHRYQVYQMRTLPQ
ncbi:MAG: hypothetical protein KDJ41_10860 [Hyphomicrobiaceae bacterium]|nr:hypothetical protein [Hyphomicrobiaceae bacterium]